MSHSLTTLAMNMRNEWWGGGVWEYCQYSMSAISSLPCHSSEPLPPPKKRLILAPTKEMCQKISEFSALLSKKLVQILDYKHIM